jgi:hypothetical protein
MSAKSYILYLLREAHITPQFDVDYSIVALEFVRSIAQSNRCRHNRGDNEPLLDDLSAESDTVAVASVVWL